MKRFFFICLLIITAGSAALAQRTPNRNTNHSIVGDDLSNNVPTDDNPLSKEDSTRVDPDFVPVELFQWTIDQRFGNTFHTEVDTIWHQFQNSNLTEGINGEYNHLGNLGSPRFSRIFFNQEEQTQRFFTDPYSMFYIRPEQFRFTNTKSPFSNITYHSAGDKVNGEDRLKAYFAVNANKDFGAGFLFDYLYGRGRYSDQSTSFFNTSLFAYYTGEQYQMHFLAGKNHMKMAENGGITDDRYITDPLAMAEGKKKFEPENIPVVMDRTWNRNDNYNILFTHRYNLGFYREIEDSTMEKNEFVPVSSFIHTVNVSTNERKFITYKEPDNYYLNNYLPNDSVDQTKYFSIKNTIGISLREGFNKWAQAGLTAFLSYEYRDFTLPDFNTITENSDEGPTEHIMEFNRKYKENIVSVGGELARTMGKTLHYNITGETVISGEDLGQFSLDGRADLNFRLFKDTVRLDAKAYIKNTNPLFYYRHYHSHHYWWDNEDLSKELRTRIEGNLCLLKTQTNLRIGVENIKNYTYFANASQAYTQNDESISFANNIAVEQSGDNIQVFTAMLKQDFKLGIFHLENEVTYQKTSDKDILPLPELSLYHNLYMSFKLAKVLSMKLGADVRYFTKYNAPDYSPSLGQFYQQNQDNKVEIGGYPFVNVYLNAHLKRTRFYVMMYHVNQGTGNSNYFLAPHYPANPRTFKVGLSWNFFD